MQWGARVKPGMRVVQGQVLSLAGCVGISLMDHVHFHITTNPFGGDSQPVTFGDASCRSVDGVPNGMVPVSIDYASDNEDQTDSHGDDDDGPDDGYTSSEDSPMPEWSALVMERGSMYGAWMTKFAGLQRRRMRGNRRLRKLTVWDPRGRSGGQQQSTGLEASSERQIPGCRPEMSELVEDHGQQVACSRPARSDPGTQTQDMKMDIMEINDVQADADHGALGVQGEDHLLCGAGQRAG